MTVQEIKQAVDSGKVVHWSTSLYRKDSQILAFEFGRVLTEWLGVERMRIVNLLNLGTDGSECHSHDFCDANQAMLDAFENVFGREMETNGETKQGSDDIDLVNDAWNIAKVNGFGVQSKNIITHPFFERPQELFILPDKTAVFVGPLNDDLQAWYTGEVIEDVNKFLDECQAGQYDTLGSSGVDSDPDSIMSDLLEMIEEQSESIKEHSPSELTLLRTLNAEMLEALELALKAIDLNDELTSYERAQYIEKITKLLNKAKGI